MYGQLGVDSVYGDDEERDIVYGGDGQSDNDGQMGIVEGGGGDDDVRDRGDDVPKNDQLTEFATRVLTAVATLDNHLQSVLANRSLPVGPLPFDERAGNVVLELPAPDAGDISANTG